MAHEQKQQAPAQVEYQSLAGCLPRIVWMGVGNIALVLAALAIYKSTDGWTIADLLFWTVVGLLIGARYVDIVRFQGATAEGQPATMAHLRRYVIVLLATAAALWTLTRALGPGFP